VITAAHVIGKIDGVARVAIDARLAQLAGCAAVPVSSGRTDCYRLDRGGNASSTTRSQVIGKVDGVARSRSCVTRTHAERRW
jgi:hypothetical protein